MVAQSRQRYRDRAAEAEQLRRKVERCRPDWGQFGCFEYEGDWEGFVARTEDVEKAAVEAVDQVSVLCHELIEGFFGRAGERRLMWMCYASRLGTGRGWWWSVGRGRRSI